MLTERSTPAGHHEGRAARRLHERLDHHGVVRAESRAEQDEPHADLARTREPAGELPGGAAEHPPRPAGDRTERPVRPAPAQGETLEAAARDRARHPAEGLEQALPQHHREDRDHRRRDGEREPAGAREDTGASAAGKEGEADQREEPLGGERDGRVPGEARHRRAGRDATPDHEACRGDLAPDARHGEEPVHRLSDPHEPGEEPERAAPAASAHEVLPGAGVERHRDGVEGARPDDAGAGRRQRLEHGRGALARDERGGDREAHERERGGEPGHGVPPARTRRRSRRKPKNSTPSRRRRAIICLLRTISPRISAIFPGRK